MSSRLLTRVYALLLRLYPREHRRSWGAGMQATFDRRTRASADAGVGARLKFLFKEFGSVLATALKERSTRTRSPRSPRRHTVRNPLDWMQDIRFGLRMLASTPGLTAVILVTLALGMGFNGSIFSLLNTIALNELPVEEPHDLLFANGSNFSQNRASIRISYPDYEYFAANTRSVRNAR